MPLPVGLLGVAVLTLVGAVADLRLGAALGWGTAAGFVLGCALAAARARHKDLVATVIAPPLVFAACLLVLLPFVPPLADGLLTRTGLGLLAGLASGAPVLWAGTLSALAIAMVRGRRVARARG